MHSCNAVIHTYTTVALSMPQMGFLPVHLKSWKKNSDALKQSGKLMTSPYQSSGTCLKSVSLWRMFSSCSYLPLLVAFFPVCLKWLSWTKQSEDHGSLICISNSCYLVPSSELCEFHEYNSEHLWHMERPEQLHPGKQYPSCLAVASLCEPICLLI